MLNNLIPLIQSFLPMFGYVLWFVFAGYFIVWVFDFLRYILRG